MVLHPNHTGRGFRPEFAEALRLLGKALALYRSRGADVPVLVGGAAVEYYTHGGINTGDLDIVVSNAEAFAQAITAVGFRHEDRPGRLERGFYHPDLPIGVEVVSGLLFDGRADRTRLGIVLVEGNEVIFPPIEDLIADRLAQHEASLRQDQEMLVQARLLYELAEGLDQDYLLRRVHEEGGDPALLVDSGQADANPTQPR
jgi:hypothetical protein